MPQTMTPVADLDSFRQYRTRTARQLAHALTANHDALVTGSIDAGAYVAESRRLWQLAAAHRVTLDTYALVNQEN